MARTEELKPWKVVAGNTEWREMGLMREVSCVFMLIICFMGFNNSAIEKVNPSTWFRNENITKQ